MQQSNCSCNPPPVRCREVTVPGNADANDAEAGHSRSFAIAGGRMGVVLTAGSRHQL